MRCSSTVICLVAAMVLGGLSGCHSTGSFASRSWTNSSFNPTTWRAGIQQTPSSLAAAPPAFPAKPSTTATPSYPNTSASSSLASATAPPAVTYPTSPASYSSPGSTALGVAAKNPLMAPQTGRYATGPIASNAPGGFVNPIYQQNGSSAALAQNPYRSTAPTVPQSNGSLAGGTDDAMPSPYSNATDSRYRAAIASSAAASYSNDPNSRYYTGTESQTATTSATPFGSQTMPQVAGGYPTTSSASPVISTAKAPSGSYPNIPSQPTASTLPHGSAPAPVNVTAPVNYNMPATSSPTTTTPSNTYQPGANGYQPGANQYVPGQNNYTPGENGYQPPAVHYTAPIQSGSQVPPMFPMVPSAAGNTSSTGGQAPAFRPGSTGTVPAYYPQSNGSIAPTSPYSNTQGISPVQTSNSTSSVVPAGFNQDATVRR